MRLDRAAVLNCFGIINYLLIYLFCIFIVSDIADGEPAVVLNSWKTLCMRTWTCSLEHVSTHPTFASSGTTAPKAVYRSTHSTDVTALRCQLQVSKQVSKENENSARNNRVTAQTIYGLTKEIKSRVWGVNCTRFLFVDELTTRLVHQSLAGQTPAYLADDIQLATDTDRRPLRSAAARTCFVPRTHKSFGDRRFSAAVRVTACHTAPTTRHEHRAFPAWTVNTSVWDFVNHSAPWLPFYTI